jgi:peroxiredoxin
MKYVLITVFLLISLFSCSNEQLKESLISGKINYDEGAPADSVYIGLYSLSAKNFLGKYIQLKETTKDSFSFTVQPGLYTLAVYSYEFEPFRKNIFIPDTSTHIKLEIELPRLSLPEKIDKVILCSGKGRGMNWRIEKPMHLKNNKWVFNDSSLLKKEDKYQFKVNGHLMIWNRMEKEYDVNYAMTTINSIYKGGEILFDPALYKKPKRSASSLCRGMKKEYDLKQLAEDLDAVDGEVKKVSKKLKNLPYEKADSLFKEITETYDHLAEKYGSPFDQLFIEKRIYSLGYSNPAFRELQKILIESKGDTSRVNKFYKSDKFKNYIEEYVELLKRLDPSSFLLSGRFVVSYLLPFQLLESSPLIQKELNLPQDYFAVQLMNFAEQTNSKQCAVNILYTLGFMYSRMPSQEAHKKAVFILEKLKNNYPDDKKVRSGSVDKALRGLKIDVDSKAPDFSLKTVSGDSLKLSQFRGKFVMLDFWGTWCAPCRREIPNLIKVYNKFSRDELIVVGLAKDKAASLAAYIKEKKIPYPNALVSEKIIKEYGVSAFPTTFLIGPEGIIIAKNLRGEDLAEKIKEKVNEYKNNKK